METLAGGFLRGENTLTVNEIRLRKKLEQIGLGGWIRTKVGSGYLIE